jgi:CRP-like cAMP-binding protein
MKQATFLEELFNQTSIPKNELPSIVAKYRRVAYKKDAFLLKEGQVEKSYWFIESGFVRSYVIDTSGTEITFNLYGPEDAVVDYPSMFFSSPTRENIHAVSDCVCWEIDFKDFQELFHTIPSYRDQQRGLLVDSYFSLKERSISLISDQAKDRYLKLLRQKPLILQHVPLKYIATFLGVTDTSLSRIRKEITNS